MSDTATSSHPLAGAHQQGADGEEGDDDGQKQRVGNGREQHVEHNGSPVEGQSDSLTIAPEGVKVPCGMQGGVFMAP